MRDLQAERPSWGQVLEKHRILALPVAHDAVTARLIELAGFSAYQIGGFALAAILQAVPDIDLEHYGEVSEMVGNIIPASPLPALVDGDNGYRGVKNVTRTVCGYEFMGPQPFSSKTNRRLSIAAIWRTRKSCRSKRW